MNAAEWIALAALGVSVIGWRITYVSTQKQIEKSRIQGRLDQIENQAFSVAGKLLYHLGENGSGPEARNRALELQIMVGRLKSVLIDVFAKGMPDPVRENYTALWEMATNGPATNFDRARVPDLEIHSMKIIETAEAIAIEGRKFFNEEGLAAKFR